jgi:nicotinamidase-related amidase
MKTALLIVDIQNDYFQNGANSLVGSEKASLNARKILNKFRADGLPVVFIQHLAVQPTATFFLPNTKGVEIHKNVEPLPNEKIIIKHYPNSFRETELLDYLRSINITDLVICGMMTQMCIDATARAAKDFGFNIILIGDACATKDLEIGGEIVKASEVQNSFLSALNYFYTIVKTTEEYLIRI